jgi:hypothetical protein
MKKLSILLLAIGFLGLTGCAPNLVIQTAKIDFAAKTVSFTEINKGNKNAGPHLTYVEINQVGVDERAKPQTQYMENVPAIAAGGSWSSGFIPFDKFSQPRDLDLSTVTTANLVVRADAKNMVKESNESDNVYNVIQ